MKRSLLAMLVLAFSSASWGGVEVGWVTKITGNPSQVKIVRNAASVVAVPFLAIENGDRIEVSGGDAVIEVSFANGTTAKVIKDRPLNVASSERVPTLGSNLMHWLLTLGKEDQKAKSTVTASARSGSDGDSLSMPLLRDSNNLVAGERNLALAWKGGKAPYALKLLRRDTRAITASFDNLATNHIFEKVNVKPGQYEVVVSDASGSSWREKLIVVADRSLPEPPDELKNVSASLRPTMVAYWLASIDDGSWTLEAYTLLAQQYTGHPAAEALANALAAGEKIEAR